MKLVRLALAASLALAYPCALNAQQSIVDLSASAAPQEPSTSGLALAAPFRGKAGPLGWRLAGMFVSGLEYSVAGNYAVQFLDAELPLHLTVSRHDLTPPSTVVGPFQRTRSEIWRPTMTEMGITQVGFSASDGSQPSSRFTLALDPSINATALADYLCRDSRTRLWSLVVPQSSAGERFARGFALAAAQCSGAALSAVTWYRDDLEDLAVRAREHYGIDRIPLETLEQQRRTLDSVEGVLQSDVTLVIASPDNLPRLINELQYQGSSFQVFVGDFNFGHAKVLSDVKWSVSPVFLDHYPRNNAITRSAGFANFLQSGQKFVKGQPTTADLLLYEAGQLVAQGAFGTATEATFEAAGGALRENVDGSFILPMYPLSVSNGTVIPAPAGIIDALAAKQKEQHQKFLQAREAARAEKAKKQSN